MRRRAEAAAGGLVAAGSLPMPGTVHVWIIDLDRHRTDAARLSSHLNEEELARAARLRFPILRSRFIVRRYAYRAILSQYLGSEPRHLRFAAGPFGKPTLSRTDIDYNSTHSDAVAMLAVTDGSAVGVDIERIRDLGDRYEWLSADERRDVLRLAPRYRTADALKLWTRKEAYVKALGVGVTALDATLRAPLAPVGKPRWTLTDLDAGPGYVASLAVPFDEPRIVPLRFDAPTTLPADPAR